MNMNMKMEQGFSTLLITVVISLIMALYVFSLLSVELFNSKKTQNIIISQELKSMSASGLQCAVDIILRSGQKPTSIDYKLCVDAVITAIQIPATSTYKVTSTATDDDAESTMSQLFTSSSMNGPQATISSSGTIKFIGSYDVFPFEGAKEGNGYNCSAIRSGKKVITEGGIIVKYPIDDDWKQKKEADGTLVKCNSSHQTVGSIYKKDIVENIADMDLFKENFAVDRDNWQEAKNLFDEIILGTEEVANLPDGKGGSKPVVVSVAKNCASKINEIIERNRAEQKKADEHQGYEAQLTRYVWVEGACDLSGVGSGRVEPNEIALTLVVKDGLLTVKGNISFHGNLYLFDYEMTDEQLLAFWELNSLKSEASPWGDLSKKPFFFNGAFESQGAFTFDSPNRICTIRGAFTPGYSKGKVDYEESRFGKTVMLEGSWHDF
ncbi:hypothetical protein [Photobacterium sanguinicancri]|uniref:hypothetical protein n=1 Tax=Photobacterium sanguinicancri TaxID=875932 RepID=UPI0021C2A052|nr:hypothetical protein [Photobacterium sanguinicancri]